MTRFIYLADTHIGAGATGYYQQPRYTAYLPAIINSLHAWIEADGGVDFILHGGDMVDHVTVENIHTASALFTLPVPVYLCLGNHDMDHPRAAYLWLTEAPQFFPGGNLNFTVKSNEMMLHVMPTHWCNQDFYWDGDHQSPHVLEEQITGLITSLTETDNMHIVCTHGEIAGVPAGQTGFEAPYHPPLSHYTDMMCQIVEHFPQIKCIFSAHNHINTCVKVCENETRAVTVSAVSETPFEFKVIDISADAMTMRTENLMDVCGFRASYDFNKTFVQGRLKDRTFTLNYAAS